jgi:hypothetical protein
VSILAFLGHRQEQKVKQQASVDHGQALVQIGRGVLELLSTKSNEGDHPGNPTRTDKQRPIDRINPSVLQGAIDQEWESSSHLYDEQTREPVSNLDAESSAEQDLVDWNDELSSDLQLAIDDKDCYWTIQWRSGKSTDDINLIYQTDPIIDSYEVNMPVQVRNILEGVRREEPAEFARLSQEPPGVKVRLERLEFDHNSYITNIYLSPSKYLYYVAIHRKLDRPELRDLRASVMDNALHGLQRKAYLALPSLFSVHMAVVSVDGYALLRQRTEYTELFPSAWESGIGEFMHGPHYSAFPHFNRRKNPKLQLFLSQAIAEEVMHSDADPNHYRVFGFAIERQTLAPKLLAVYRSSATIDTLLEGASVAKDSARSVAAIELTPEGIASAFTDSRYAAWGPTSKLSVMLALTQHATSLEERQLLVAQVRECMGN